MDPLHLATSEERRTGAPVSTGFPKISLDSLRSRWAVYRVRDRWACGKGLAEEGNAFLGFIVEEEYTCRIACRPLHPGRA